MVIAIMKLYFVLVVILMLVYAVRHAIFSFNRMFGRQRMYYGDIFDSEMPYISILIPMHNEEKVARGVLDALLKCKYDRDLLEIIPINDNSTDGTKAILEEYNSRYPFIRPHHRIDTEERGKPIGLNEAIQLAKGEIIIVFDADYRPTMDVLLTLAVSFKDPEAGAVMGRLVPLNITTNQLTRMLNMERSGGYQADQQARYNLRVMPQYGGTVGGFRKAFIVDTGGFDTKMLAEDTELTYRIYTKGYKVIYANGAECYEEVPETWEARAKQIRRWSRGHNGVLFRYFFRVLFSRWMSVKEKIDGVMLLLVYAIPFIFCLSLVDSIALFFLGEMDVMAGWWAIVFVSAYNSYGNFAPFYEIATALMMDGIHADIRLLPLMIFVFYFYLKNISLGFLDAVSDVVTKRRVKWDKTVRFNEAEAAEEATVTLQM